MKNITPTALAKASGISLCYASQILNGKRAPARPLAIHIFRTTGWRVPRIADLTEDQMAMLEVIDPQYVAKAAA